MSEREELAGPCVVNGVRACRWEWIVCAGGGAIFNIYRCRTCGAEDWL